MTLPRHRRPLATLAAAVAIILAASALWAQPDGDNAKGNASPDSVVPMGQKANLTAKEMRSTSETLINEMKTMLERVIAVQQVARKQKDVIRLNCVNDRLLQIKKLLNLAEASRNDMVVAIVEKDATDRAMDQESGPYHFYSKVVIAHENTSVLRDEAEACIGEELIFIGPTQVEVDKPAIPDDPTRQDPFILTQDGVVDDGIERPAYASPYL